MKITFQHILLFFILLSTTTVVSFNYTILQFIAVPNIAAGFLLFVECLWMYTNKKIIFNLKPIFCIAIILIPLFYCVGAIIHNEDLHTTIAQFQLRTVAILYLFIIVFLPSKTIIYKSIFYSFIVITGLICIVTFLNYFNYFYSSTGDSNTIDWLNHIEYSYPFIIPFKINYQTISVSIVIALLFCAEIFENFNTLKFEKYLLFILAIILIICLHFISARIGLICFYLLALYKIKKYFYSNNKIYFAICISTIILILITGYLTIPSFSKKINSITVNTNDKYSSKYNRILSYKIGFEIIKDNFLIGVGARNHHQYYTQFYSTHYPGVPELRPHNQFLFYATLYGVPLSLAFILIILFPILYYWKLNNELLWMFYCINILYFMVDMPFNIREYFYIWSFICPLLFHYSIYTKNINIINTRHETINT